ncbi:MAG: hypothetical protein GY928_15790 [Colwellia sp.]|nr:hypothetical protein [Colwellia sp.]
MKDEKKYYIYHIPGKKIGVTCDLINRVTVQQGYAPGEYEILEEHTDIDVVSVREIQLQKAYGYKVDRKLYKNLKPKTNMRINITEQTTTFPCPKGDLEKNLLDNKGLTWETEHGEFQINEHTIPWMLTNVKTSMYNEDRCYIYNKAFAYNFPKDYINKDNKVKPTGSVFDDIRKWARDRGIYASGDLKTQYVKLQEESGELAKALLDRDDAEIQDAIGDMVVVLTNLAELSQMRIEDCIDAAYDEISTRKGKMINGTFVKEDNLSVAEQTLLLDGDEG